MISLLLAATACDRPNEPPPSWVRTTTPSEPTVDAPSVWDEIGPCGRPAGVVPLPDPAPATCAPAAPGWVSGPVASWARARVVAPFENDRLGYSLAAVDPDGDGADALVVGAPRLGLPEQGYRGAGADGPQWPRTYLFGELAGEVRPTRDAVIASEHNSPENSIGQSAASLTPHGPILLGDYWGPAPGHVEVLDGSIPPLQTIRVAGDAGDTCGADVGVADVDGSGTPDILTACLRAPLTERGTVGGFRQRGTTWEPFFRIEGTIPGSWFGRPTVGGFDLDRDGRADLAIGEQNAGSDLESLVHLISGPWEGDCTLEEVGASTLRNGFPPARVIAADVDGDGVGELIVTSQGYPITPYVPDPLLGQVVVLRDWPDGDGQVEDFGWLVLEGVDPEESFGAGVAVGDFNADGCADVAVGAPGHNYTVDLAPGRVYVFHGPFSGEPLSAADAQVVLEGSHPDDRFGWPLQVGDYDGDGVDDLAVAAQRDQTGGDEAGAVYVLAGVPPAP